MQRKSKEADVQNVAHRGTRAFEEPKRQSEWLGFPARGSPFYLFVYLFLELDECFCFCQPKIPK